MKQIYCFSNHQDEPVIVIDEGKGRKKIIDREIFVIAESELEARIKVKRKDENFLGQDYELVKIEQLGLGWDRRNTDE